MPYPHSITRHKYWIYKTTRQARPVKFVIIHSHHTTLYESDTVHIKKPSFQELLLYKMVGDPSFPRPYLFIERPLTSLLVRKTTSKISTNTAFRYISLLFHMSGFTYSYPYSLHQKTFLLHQPFSQFRLL